MYKVISGGQTGADRIGLEVAREMGVPTGGFAPLNFRTEDGPDRTLDSFGLIPTGHYSYSFRTRLNVQHSTGTVLFGDMSSAGSLQTIQACHMYKKPYITNPIDAQELSKWIKNMDIVILNVAGNRGSKLDTIKKLHIANILRETFKILGYNKIDNQ